MHRMSQASNNTRRKKSKRTEADIWLISLLKGGTEETLRQQRWTHWIPDFHQPFRFILKIQARNNNKLKALQGDPYGSTIKCTQNIYRTHMYGCKGPRFFSTGASTTSVPGRSQYRGGSLVSVPGRSTGWSKHKMRTEHFQNIHRTSHTR